MQNLQDTFETRKQSNISDLSISIILPLNQEEVDIRIALNCSEDKRYWYLNFNIACVVILNCGSVDPDPYVTWKLESHVEIFSRWKTDFEEAVNIYSVLAFIVVLHGKY